MIRKYLTQQEFNDLDGTYNSNIDYIIVDANNSPQKVVFMTNNITGEMTEYIIEDEYPTPQGTVYITSNGKFDIKQYETANIEVPNIEGSINITQNGTYNVATYASAEVEVVPPDKTCSFIIKSNGNFAVTKIGLGSYYLKVNDGDWVEYTTDALIEVSADDIVELKSKLKPAVIRKPLYNDSTIYFSAAQTLAFGSLNTCTFELEGDILDVLYDNELTIGACCEMFYECTALLKVPIDMLSKCGTSFACFAEMFDGCTNLQNAPSLPATTLASNCYQRMFRGCAALTTAPLLPATTLANNCYHEMFRYCSNLTTIPETLPATTPTQSCYNTMFDSCSSLISTPTIKLTRLLGNSCRNMFRDCTSLTTANIEMPVTSGLNGGAAQMFQRCANLNYVKCLATEISTSIWQNWLSRVAATGTFVKDANTTWHTGTSGIPSGWTVEDAA